MDLIPEKKFRRNPVGNSIALVGTDPYLTETCLKVWADGKVINHVTWKSLLAAKEVLRQVTIMDEVFVFSDIPEREMSGGCQELVNSEVPVAFIFEEASAVVNRFCVKLDAVVDVKGFREYQIPEAIKWLVGECEEKDLELDFDAADALVNRVGTDLMKLTTETRKLFLLSDMPNRNHAIAISDGYLEATKAVVDLVMMRRDGVVAKVSRAISLGADVELILNSISYGIIELVCIWSVEREAQDDTDIIRKAKLDHRRAKFLLYCYKMWSSMQIKKVVKLLITADRMIKDEGLDEGSVLVWFLLRLSRFG